MSVEEMLFKAKKNNTELAGKSFSLNSGKDLVTIREFGRILASDIGFESKDQTFISTALSEICRNVIEYAGSGEDVIEPGNSVRYIRITVSDSGPGIEDMNKALQEGYSTGQGLGVGLPGARRIMDSLKLNKTSREQGTTIKMCKWLENHYQF